MAAAPVNVAFWRFGEHVWADVSDMLRLVRSRADELAVAAEIADTERLSTAYLTAARELRGLANTVDAEIIAALPSDGD